MNATKPLYCTYAVNDNTSGRANAKHFGIKIARTLNDIMHVTAIRAAVFVGEQSCPFEEEFDGNDFCSTHLIGYVGDEPAACLRARFFADFAKLERLAVRHEYRNTRLSFDIVKAGIDLARKKGYGRIYGHAQDRLVKFWSRFGAKPIKREDHPLVFSDYSYTEMLLETDPDPDPITLDSDPYMLIRPEGEWHVAGVLERSATRPVSEPIRQMQRR